MSDAFEVEVGRGLEPGIQTENYMPVLKDLQSWAMGLGGRVDLALLRDPKIRGDENVVGGVMVANQWCHEMGIEATGVLAETGSLDSYEYVVTSRGLHGPNEGYYDSALGRLMHGIRTSYGKKPFSIIGVADGEDLTVTPSADEVEMQKGGYTLKRTEHFGTGAKGVVAVIRTWKDATSGNEKWSVAIMSEKRAAIRNFRTQYVGVPN